MSKIPTNTTTAATATSSPPSLSTFVTHTRQQTENLVSKRRPWRDFFDYTSVSIPISYEDAVARIRQNLNYFRVNYALVMLVILFMSLFYHPVSMIVYLAVFVLWLFFYFLRDVRSPVMLFNRIVDDRVVLVVLSLVTVIVLCFTSIGMNVLVSLMIGVVVVGLHAAFRCPDDLFLDESDAAQGGLLSVVSEGLGQASYGLN